MKKKSILLCLLFFTLSFYSQRKQFEKKIGITNSKNLNLLINHFEENILREKFPDVETNKAYKLFLQKYINQEINLEDKIFNYGYEILKKNKLEMNIYQIIDSTWIGESVLVRSTEKLLIAKYKFIDTKGKIGYSISETSIKKDRMPFDEKDININGKYFDSLGRSHNRFIKSYVENINLTGTFRNKMILAEIILSDKVNINNYFMKTIILTNIVYL